MPNITVDAGPVSFAINPADFDLKDLGKGSMDLPLVLGREADQLLEGPISAAADGLLTTLSLSAGTPQWSFGGLPGTPTFSLSAGTSATIQVQSRGPLFSYFSDFDRTRQEEVGGAQGAVYLITEFSFHISDDLAASAPLGSVGVTADVGGSAKFTVRNYKPFAPGEKVKDAILKALAAFTLPLHSETVRNLDDGSAIYYTFDGALHVGFGATYGVKTTVGGFSLKQINSTLAKVGNVVNVSTSGVTVGASAGLSLKFNWSRTFECFLCRSGQTATLHLSAGQSTSRALGLTANGGITAISPPMATVDADIVTSWIAQKTGAGDLAAKALGEVVGKGKDEVQKYVDDANHWLASLTQTVKASGDMSLAVLFESSSKFTSAFSWEFDCGSASFEDAWREAVRGDFVAALATGGAKLTTGSGYESLHFRNTKVTLSLFGLEQFSAVDTYFDKSTLRYANGQFYLETLAGKVSTSSSKSRSSSTSVYLDGTKEGAGVCIQLHGILSSAGDKGQFERLGNLARGIGQAYPGAAASRALVELGNRFTAAARHAGTAALHLVFDMAALATLPADAQNWFAYALAGEIIPSDPALYLRTWIPANVGYQNYAAWAKFNCAVNGSVQPDRHLMGNFQASVVRGSFGTALRDMDCRELAFYFYAGQQFMNLCDDVRTLVVEIDSGVVLDWDTITRKLEAIAGTDLDSWYGGTVLLAMAKAVQGQTMVMERSGLTSGEVRIG